MSKNSVNQELTVVSTETREAFDELSESFDRFCLRTGLEALETLMAEEVEQLCGPSHARDDQQAYRWGSTKGEVPFHGGKVQIKRPRVRDKSGKEKPLDSYLEARDHALLSRWAMNQMLLGVTTRRFGRSVRLPEGDIPRQDGDGTSKSAVSRRFVALSQVKMQEWLQQDLSDLDLLVIQIDGLVVNKHSMIAAMGIDTKGIKHPLSLMEGATENHVVVQALLDDLIERGVNPKRAMFFLLDGSKALSKAVRNTYGQLALIQRCQVHKSRNILDRLDEAMKISVRKALRQAWDAESPELAEKLLRNLANRLKSTNQQAAASILEGLDEILCLIRLGLPPELRKALATTNAIENMMGTIRRVTRNVKRWKNSNMRLRWTAAGMLEAKKGFQRLRAYRQLPHLKAKLEEHTQKVLAETSLQKQSEAA
ncbi:IS256-like element ISMama1 family transposase [Magnetococcus marinus]|uniref:IS256-like element ISMama1 family transposase n=1 Tax=Magnetococcus marinus TaxID=1124597 RepID=UPI00003C58ED|nr:IS256-like element ISMama1 family transposase [Magnetococcus marinus]